jgi:hypothetical protein
MAARRQPENAPLGYADTPMLPGTEYHVHDGERPQPRVVTPGVGTQAPSDAKVLFDGRHLRDWEGKDGTAKWKLEAGYMEVVPGTGNIRTREQFGDIQLHLEFASPAVVKGAGQGRGNSGVFLMGRYEIQVLDSYSNPTYADGTVGALYGQYPPLVNAMRFPGEWNGYDIIWRCPVFDGARLIQPALLTVLFNGVLLHHALAPRGPTDHRVLTSYAQHPPKGPLELQDHGDLVRFRNIWLRELRGYDE